MIIIIYLEMLLRNIHLFQHINKNYLFLINNTNGIVNRVNKSTLIKKIKFKNQDYLELKIIEFDKK
jgi:hypothetical protein